MVSVLWLESDVDWGGHLKTRLSKVAYSQCCWLSFENSVGCWSERLDMATPASWYYLGAGFFQSMCSKRPRQKLYFFLMTWHKKFTQHHFCGQDPPRFKMKLHRSHLLMKGIDGHILLQRILFEALIWVLFCPDFRQSPEMNISIIFRGLWWLTTWLRFQALYAAQPISWSIA